MITNDQTWTQLENDFRICTDGPWRKSAVMRPGRRLESQIFSSSSLANVRSIGAFSIIRTGASIGGVTIGRFSAIGAGLVCAPPEHPVSNISASSVFLKDYPWTRAAEGFYGVPQSGDRLQVKPVNIGNDVWIGRDVYIRGGVSIGDGAIIAGRSVVTRDVPPYAVVAGVPGRIVRQRFSDDTVAALVDLRWWDLDPQWLSEVDQRSVDNCVEFLTAERHRIAELQPRAIVFTETAYQVEQGA